MKFTVSPALLPAEHYIELAQSAEAEGWDCVCLPDAGFFPEKVSADYPYTADGNRFWQPETHWLDPYVAIPAMAAATKTIKFTTSILKLGTRNPLLVAKMLSSAAVLAPGRIMVGVGIGWMPEEFKWCGQEYKGRGRRVSEAIEVIKLCMTGEWVEYHGKYYDFERIKMTPGSAEPIPLYVGGHSKPALRRAAKYGDGWTSAMATKKQLAKIIEDLTTYRTEFGREKEPFEIQAVCMDVFTADGYKELEAMGVTDIITQPWMFYGFGPQATPAQQREALARFREDVIEKVNS